MFIHNYSPTSHLKLVKSDLSRAGLLVSLRLLPRWLPQGAAVCYPVTFNALDSGLLPRDICFVDHLFDTPPHPIYMCYVW